MSPRTRQVTLHILDKDYVVACPESEREGLMACADYLSHKMQEVKERGKVVGTERLLVMTALNIIHELLHKNEKSDYTEATDLDIERLQNKINNALSQQQSVL